MGTTKKIVVTVVTMTTLFQLLTTGCTLDRNLALRGEVEKPPVIQNMLIENQAFNAELKPLELVVIKEVQNTINTPAPTTTQELPTTVASTPTPNPEKQVTATPIKTTTTTTPKSTTVASTPATPVAAAPTKPAESTKIQEDKETLRQQYAEKLYAYSDYEYFIDSCFERYVNYMEKHPTYSCPTVIRRVNVGLDNPFYTSIKQVSDPSSLTVLANKYYQLPSTYAPKDLQNISAAYRDDNIRYLRKDACEAFEQMCVDAKQLGLKIVAISTYRSYSTQNSVYWSKANKNDPESIKRRDKVSARPGHSEHQTGLAVDVIGLDEWIENTKEYKWYCQNAHKYGFIIRYPKGTESITGYSYEPWHLRYLGIELATAVYESGLTFDEYCGQHLELLPDMAKEQQTSDKTLTLSK